MPTPIKKGRQCNSISASGYGISDPHHGPEKRDGKGRLCAARCRPIDLEKKEVTWTTKFVGDGTLPITKAGDTEIWFGEKGWTNAETSFSPTPLPDAESHYTQYGKLNRVTGELEYFSQTTWDRPEKGRNDVKAGDVFGDKWKMKCGPARRIF